MGVLPDYAKLKNNADANDNPVTAKDDTLLISQASVFLAGKVTNSLGVFSQFTYDPYAGVDQAGQSKGFLVQDNTDIRFARSIDRANQNVIWGLTLHNSPSVQDVWNSSPAWGYPYVARNGALGVPNDVAATFIESGNGPFAGFGGYVYWDKTIYLELTSYQTAHNGLSFLSLGHHANDALGNNLLTFIDGSAPYARVAYTKEYGAHNIMFGGTYLNVKIYPTNADGTGSDFSASRTQYKDSSLDSQYGLCK